MEVKININPPALAKQLPALLLLHFLKEVQNKATRLNYYLKKQPVKFELFTVISAPQKVANFCLP